MAKKKRTRKLSSRLVRHIFGIATLLIITATVLVFFILNILVTQVVSGLTEDSVTRFERAISDYEETATLTVSLASSSTSFVEAVYSNNSSNITKEANKIQLRSDAELLIVTDTSGNRVYETVAAGDYVDESINHVEIDEALDQAVTTAISEGVDGVYTLRVGAPIYYQNQLVGTISAGSIITNTDLLENARQDYGGHFSIYKNTEFISTSLDETYYEDLSGVVTEEDIELMQNGEIVSKVVSLNGDDWAISMSMLVVTEGENAIVVNSQNLSVFGNQLYYIVLAMAIGMFLVAGVSAMLIYFNIRRNITKPIRKLTNVASSIGKGIVDVELEEVKTGDEIEILNETFKSLVKTTKEKSEIMDLISKGDIIDSDFHARDEDALAKGMVRVIETLNQFSNELNQMIQGVSVGNFRQVVNTNHFEGVYEQLGQEVNYVVNYLVENINEFPNPVVVTNADMDVQFVNHMFKDMVNKTNEELIGKHAKEVFFIDFESDETNSFIQAMKTKKLYSSNGVFKVNEREYKVLISSLPNVNEEGVVETVTHTLIDQTEILNSQQVLIEKQEYQLNEVERLTSNLEKLSSGQFDLDFEMDKPDASVMDVYTTFKTINNSLELSVSNISNYIKQISFVLNEISNSNLNISVEGDYVGEFSTIKESMINILNELNQLTSEIKSSSERVQTESTSVTDSSLELNKGATEQAAAIEEISATITQVSAQVRENASKAEIVKSMVSENETGATHASELMEDLLVSMKEITNASNNVAKVLKMINDIAFQTNILSLNAAVEAARAGQHGKGFAVIAEDVRNLALKSASASDETDEMMSVIREKIEIGSEIASQTAQSLTAIVSSSVESSKLSNEVALASGEQSTAIAQITTSIDQISSIVQSTSANARKSNDIAMGLSKEAELLNDIVSVFQLLDEDSVLVVDESVQSKSLTYSPTGEFEWTGMYDVGVEEMNDHHKKLFEITDRLYFGMMHNQSKNEISQMLLELLDYTIYHFGEEEEHMATLSDYENIENHKKMHQAFIDKIAETKHKFDTGSIQTLEKEILDLLVDWLVNHILKVDKEYGVKG